MKNQCSFHSTTIRKLYPQLSSVVQETPSESQDRGVRWKEIPCGAVPTDEDSNRAPYSRKGSARTPYFSASFRWWGAPVDGSAHPKRPSWSASAAGWAFAGSRSEAGPEPTGFPATGAEIARSMLNPAKPCTVTLRTTARFAGPGTVPLCCFDGVRRFSFSDAGAYVPTVKVLKIPAAWRYAVGEKTAPFLEARGQKTAVRGHVPIRIATYYWCRPLRWDRTVFPVWTAPVRATLPLRNPFWKRTKAPVTRPIGIPCVFYAIKQTV